MTQRKVERAWQAMAARDGAGVNLNRALGASQDQRLDPFLMLDAFSSADPNDYIAGFPAHPHRGFETVTYIVNGHMGHKDHLGNEGDLKAGGVDRKSTRLNSSHVRISYAVFCLKKKK